MSANTDRDGVHRPTRRQALGTLGAVAGALLAGPALLAPTSARAGATRRRGRDKIRDIYDGKRGTTIWMDLDAAPFPHKGAPYTDPTVIVFVPHYYRVHERQVDTVLHFHGHRDTAERAMKRHHLREQLWESKQNAILVIPQGPVHAEDSRGGKLDDKRGLLTFLTEVRKTLQSTRLQVKLGPAAIPRRARIGKLILSAHSGGYRVAANCVDHGGFNVNEVWLFDSLYARTSTFRDWIEVARDHDGCDRHKLISYYSGEELTKSNLSLMRQLDRLGIAYLHETREGTLSRAEITKARAVFIRTSVSHQDTLYRLNQLRDCLYASCLTRYLKSDWFEDARDPRELDKRPRTTKKD